MEENKKQAYYYCCSGGSVIGGKLLRLMDRYGEVMQAASDLCQKVGAVEFTTNERYYAGGIRYFIVKDKLREKKLLCQVEEVDGFVYCIPNPNTNRGMKLASKVAALPYVSFDHVCEPFGIDCHDPANKGKATPCFFSVECQWVYVSSGIPLDIPELNPCTQEEWEKAKEYVVENGSE